MQRLERSKLGEVISAKQSMTELILPVTSSMQSPHVVVSLFGVNPDEMYVSAFLLLLPTSAPTTTTTTTTTSYHYH